MPEPHIYLDHNSTTPLDPRVLEAMTRAWRDCGANPASQHAPGRAARRMIEEAREGILELLGAKTGGMDADRLIFTSGGTEANNLILMGLSKTGGGRLCLSEFEHPSIMRTGDNLRDQGIPVDITPLKYLSWDTQGWDPRPIDLVSVVLACSETGIIHPIADIVKGFPYAPVHTDAVQAIGRIPVNFRDLGVVALTAAAHKFHGPLGIGALVLKREYDVRLDRNRFVRVKVSIQPQLHGGFQQEGLRPGTENVALAVGFREALRLAIAELPERAERMRTLRDELERLLREAFPDPAEMVVIGATSLTPALSQREREKRPRLPNTSCVSFPGVNRQALVMALDMAGVACSTGSACASGSSEPSPTLVAMGLPKDVVDGAIRLSVGAFTTAEEVAEAARRIVKTVKHLRSAK